MTDNYKLIAKRKLTSTEDISIKVVPVKKETVKLFDENKIYTFAVPMTWNGRAIPITKVTGIDLNYAVRTVYAEAGSLKKGTAEERKAMADLLTNRIGCLGLTVMRPDTYKKVIRARHAFQCYKDEDGKPSIKFQHGDAPLQMLKGDQVKEWNLAYDAVATEIKECGGKGPNYSYTNNLKAGTEKESGWLQIGDSVFKIEHTKWKKVGNRWTAVVQGIERNQTPHPRD